MLNTKKKIVFSLTAVLISSFIALAMVEVYYRMQIETLPFETVSHRPVRMHPQMGWTFIPGKETRKANGMDYDVTQKINRYGFLDKEYEVKKKENTFRVLIIGDSFIEAVQVPIKDKIQVLLEQKLNSKGLNKNVETMAMSFSGMGTSNQLAYYRSLGKLLKPDLVVLTFISNDFGNNSPILHALAEGWFPYSSPRFFYEFNFTTKGPKFVPFPINYKYNDNHLKLMIPVKYPEQLPMDVWAMDSLLSWSKAYSDITNIMKENDRKKNQKDENFNAIEERLKFLKHHEVYAHKELDASIKNKLKDWNYPNDVDARTGFHLTMDSMPRVFNEALELTGLSLAYFKKETAQNNTKFMVMCGAYLTTEKPDKVWDRKIDQNGLIGKLKEMTVGLKIPLLDLYPEFEKRGGTDKTRWKKDSHWNHNGHAWAADALADYIISHKIIK